MRDEEVCNPPKPKRSKNRPYAIESRYVGEMKWLARWKDWHVCGRFETAKQRDQSLSASIKKQNHGFGRPWYEYRAVDLPAVPSSA
jgi:hypothetical protein